MKLLPILFSEDMIPPIQRDLKRRTRRLAGVIMPVSLPMTVYGYDKDADGRYYALLQSACQRYRTKEKAPYAPGDRLYVRENYVAYGYWRPEGYTAGGRQKFKFKNCSPGTLIEPHYYYTDAPEVRQLRIQKNSYRAYGWYKRLGRFMPKAYARIFLEVMDVRLERMQDITEDEAILEGVLEYEDGTYRNYSKKVGMREVDGVECLLARGSFMTLINGLNGPNTWKENPWVWVISFQRTTRPTDFPKSKKAIYA